MVVAEQRQEIVLLVIRRWWNDSFGMAADKSLLNQSRLRAGSVQVPCGFGAFPMHWLGFKRFSMGFEDSRAFSAIPEQYQSNCKTIQEQS